MLPAETPALSPTVQAMLALRPALLRMALARTSPEQAEDGVQQALLKALENQHKLRDPAALKAWLYRILSRTLSDMQRQQARERPVQNAVLIALSEAQTPETLDPDEISCACVLRLVDRLPPQDQTLLLETLQSHSVQSTAQQLGISPNLASVRLHRARKSLRRHLQQTCGTDSVQSCQQCACA